MQQRLFIVISSFVFWFFCGLSVWLQSFEETQPQTQTSPSTQSARVAAWSDEVLYFAIVDRFADGDKSNNIKVDRKAKGSFHGGDLKGLIAHLNEIADLGVTALWITPVVKQIDEYVTGAGFPDWAYHGYWADDFYKLDGRFGAEADLKALVDACHARGVKLLLDVVYNHAGYNTNYLKDPKTKDWFRSEDRGTCGQDDVTSCLAGLPDFKTKLPEVRDFLMTAHLGWAKKVGIDGFRLDTVKHIEHSFWKEHRTRSRSTLGQNFFLLGEVWGGDPQVLDPWFSEDEMDSGFDFSFQGNVIGFLQGRGRAIAFDRYLKSREKIRPGYLVSHFLSSHDVPGTLYQLKGDVDLFRLAAILQFTSIGIPMVYYGEEVARAGGDWPDNRSDMPWGKRKILPGAGLPRNEQLRKDYQRLIAIRRANPALSRGVHTSISTEGDLLVFLQQDAASGNAVVVAVNRGTSPLGVAFKAPSEWGANPTVKEVWNQVSVSQKDGALAAEVKPKSAGIFVPEKPK